MHAANPHISHKVLPRPDPRRADGSPGGTTRTSSSSCNPTAATSGSVSEGLADHGLTYSETEPVQRKGDRDTALITVKAGQGGVLVRWNASSGAVLVAPASVPVEGNWAKAARLVAKDGAVAVQLTILAATFRVYVDGQRLARVGSPVLVHPSQRVLFAGDATLYSIAHASTLPSSSCATAVPRARRLSSPSKPRPQKGGLRARSDSPPPRTPSPAAGPIMFQAVSESSTEGFTGDCTPPPPCDVWAAEERHGVALCDFAEEEPSPIETAYETAEVIFTRARVTEDTAAAADLLAEASLDGGEHTSDWIGSMVVTDQRATHMKGRVSRTSAPSAVAAQAAPKAITTTSTATTKDEMIQQQQQLSSLHLNVSVTAFAWGPVKSVASPNWAALAALYGETSPDAAGQMSTESGSSGSAFAAALRSRREHHRQAQEQRQQLKLATCAVVPLQQRHAVLKDCTPHESVCKSWSFSADGSCTTVDKTALETASGEASSTRVSCAAKWLDERGEASAEARADDAVRLKEKLRLKQRVAAVPFVVEAFDGTHRYRPLASKASLPDSSDEERGDTGLTPESLSDHAEQQGEGAPWEFPQAADELVTPHTEGVVRRTLRACPERTAAEKAASVLHDALRRTYDAASDRFTYMSSAGLPDLLFTTFMTVTEELLVNLPGGRPVRRLSSPLLCAGDLFGSFKDALIVLGSVAHFTHWSMLHRPLVLLGNYVDFGWHSVEVILLLCSWACLQPNKVHLLRGPHEDPLVNGNYKALGKRCLRYKCRQRFGAKRGVALWTRLNKVFALLPVAAVVDGNVLVVHGGVPQLLPSPIEGEGGKAAETGGARRQSSARHRGALYSNTSGVPTPTTETASNASFPHAESLSTVASLRSQGMHGSWRPPSALQVFPHTSEGCYEDWHVGSTSVRERAGNFSRHYTSSSSSEDSNGTATSHTAGATEEKMKTLQAATGSAVDTLAQRGDAQPWDAPSSASSFSSLTEKSSHIHHGEAATSLLCKRDAFFPSSASSAGVLGEGSHDVLSLPKSAVHKAAAASSLISHTGDLSLANDVIYALKDGRARTPLVDWSDASSEQRAPTHDAPSALAYSEDSTLADAKTPGEATSKSAFTMTTTALSTSCTDDPSAHAQKKQKVATLLLHSSDAVCACSSQPSEVDFERLLRATSMDGFSFRTLQPGKHAGDGVAGSASAEECTVARRCRLVRELLWNRPRDATARIDHAEEKAEVVYGAVRPCWWCPREVQWCHTCSTASGPHNCCHVFGSWGLVHFLSRFDFSLLVRGAPEDTSDMYGALLAEEGRLLSLLTCTRLRKTFLQAAACVLHPTTLQLATWGTQALADSRGQISLSDLPGVREQREANAQFRSFVHEQVRIRIMEHEKVGPHNRWAVASAYGEFQRQRALRQRLGDVEKET